LIELVEQELSAGHRRFIVDLRRVPWMNSRGLGRLIELWQLIRAADGQAALVCAPGRILTILEISQIDRIMNPVQDIAAAVAAFTPLD
jgi:anti-anti-sigma factor